MQRVKDENHQYLLLYVHSELIPLDHF